MLRDMCSVTGMGFAAMARVTDTRWAARQMLDGVDFGLHPGDELDLKPTICNDIRDSGTGVVIDHVAAETNWRNHPVPTLYGFESYISVPICRRGGSVFGTLRAIDPKPRTNG